MKFELGDKVLVERFEVGPLGTNSYAVSCVSTGKTALIDPGADPEYLLSMIQENQRLLTHILLTHGHIDHMGAASVIRERTDAPILIHEGDARLLAQPDVAVASMLGIPAKACEASEFLREGMDIAIGEVLLRVRETPGHSPGSVCFVGDGYSFCGDLVFAGSIGRTDLPGGSYRTIMRSIRDVILELPQRYVLLPGHGPETSVEAELSTNPYVIDASRWDEA